jgi:hypothetical protein
MTDLRPLDLIPIVPGLEHLAPLVQPWIVKGCAYSGEWTLEEIAEGLAQDKLQLWACWQSDPPEVLGGGVTRIAINKRGEKIGRDVVFAGADIDQLIPLLDRLEEFFVSQGCDAIEIHGRAGWGKKLPSYRMKSIVLRKALKDGQR